VRVALAEKKIEYQVTAAAPWDPGNPVHAYNPLGKLPVLILDDGTHLYDSRVIVEYIDLVSPVSRLIPEPARQRIAVKKWEALADGVCDATAAIVVERRRPTHLQSDEWIDRQRRKISEGVAELSRSLASARGATVKLFAGGYRDRVRARRLDLRHAELDWREAYPNSSDLPRSSASARRSPKRRNAPGRGGIALPATAPASAARGSPGSRASKYPAIASSFAIERNVGA
jgi:glutathione S-transferase